jgi:hypothetical protein
MRTAGVTEHRPEPDAHPAAADVYHCLIGLPPESFTQS